MNQSLRRRISHIEAQKKSKSIIIWERKNYIKIELNILAKAAGIPYYYTYKKHDHEFFLFFWNRKKIILLL